MLLAISSAISFWRFLSLSTLMLCPAWSLLLFIFFRFLLFFMFSSSCESFLSCLHISHCFCWFPLMWQILQIHPFVWFTVLGSLLPCWPTTELAVSVTPWVSSEFAPLEGSFLSLWFLRYFFIGFNFGLFPSDGLMFSDLISWSLSLLNFLSQLVHLLPDGIIPLHLWHCHSAAEWSEIRIIHVSAEM